MSRMWSVLAVAWAYYAVGLAVAHFGYLYILPSVGAALVCLKITWEDE